MSGGDDTWDTGSAEPDRTRFLEHTDKALIGKFESLDDGVIATLKTFPALFAYEAPRERGARLGWITDIQRHQSALKIKFFFDNRFDPIEPHVMPQLLKKLDIGDKFEIYRSHWAIKDVDLVEVMTNAGLLISARAAPNQDFEFSRQTVLKASMMHKSMSHSDFDTFVLELGISEINAGRDQGSRQARAVKLGEYAVDNGNEDTANGLPLADEIVISAARMDSGYPESVLYDVDMSTRRQFWESLARDGYGFSDGYIVTLQQLNTPNLDVSPQRILGGQRSPVPTPTNWEKHVPRVGKPKIFIVHGRDDAPKYDVARFLEKLELEAVILHEELSKGRTITDKFFAVAAEADFAVVLMTPDDVGGLINGPQNYRARQNVVFELGYFIGKLGAQNVCALLSGNVERPSDFESVVYVEYGPSTHWRGELAKELRGAGIPFNPSKVF